MKKYTKLLSLDNNIEEFESSFDNVKKLKILLENKRFLKRKGFSSEEIKECRNAFEKRVYRVLETAVKYANNEDSKRITGNMLEYMKKEGLVK